MGSTVVRAWSGGRDRRNGRPGVRPVVSRTTTTSGPGLEGPLSSRSSRGRPAGGGRKLGPRGPPRVVTRSGFAPTRGGSRLEGDSTVESCSRQTVTKKTFFIWNQTHSTHFSRLVSDWSSKEDFDKYWSTRRRGEARKEDGVCPKLFREV